MEFDAGLHDFCDFSCSPAKLSPHFALPTISSVRASAQCGTGQCIARVHGCIIVLLLDSIDVCALR